MPIKPPLFEMFFFIESSLLLSRRCCVFNIAVVGLDLGSSSTLCKECFFNIDLILNSFDTSPNFAFAVDVFIYIVFVLAISAGCFAISLTVVLQWSIILCKSTLLFISVATDKVAPWLKFDSELLVYEHCPVIELLVTKLCSVKFPVVHTGFCVTRLLVLWLLWKFPLVYNDALLLVFMADKVFSFPSLFAYNDSLDERLLIFLMLSFPTSPFA